MDRERILLVEDSPDIIDILTLHLETAGYSVSKALNCSEALQMVKVNNFDLIILDIILPDGTGYEMCKEIRESVYCPIIFMSCLESEKDVVKALESGGDDYIVKPARPKEIVARVRANLRRAKQYTHNQEAQTKFVKYHDLTLDSDEYTVSNYEGSIRITPLEFDIFLYLINSRGKKVTYVQLYEYVWKTDAFDDYRTVKVHVSNLKNKIRKISKEEVPIINIRGEGYLLKV